jgi:hypothetical protein
MAAIVGAASALLIVLVLWDAYQTIILPRRATFGLRASHYFYRWSWPFWRGVAARVSNRGRREAVLGSFGPLSLIVLLALWASLLIAGFAALHWTFGSAVQRIDGHRGFGDDLYYSVTTFTTLGIGDVEPRSTAARIITALEAAVGFGFLAVLAGYLPVLYQAFATRELAVSLLDSHAGSPPSAARALTRYTHVLGQSEVTTRMMYWETWAAQVLESHLSHAPLAYFRSQHDRQSWVATLTVMLDECALVLAGLSPVDAAQARFTFATCGRTARELAAGWPHDGAAAPVDRLPAADLARLRAFLRVEGMEPRPDPAIDAALTRLRSEYEPAVIRLSRYLAVDLPPWLPPEWETGSESGHTPA